MHACMDGYMHTGGKDLGACMHAHLHACMLGYTPSSAVRCKPPASPAAASGSLGEAASVVFASRFRCSDVWHHCVGRLSASLCRACMQ